MSLELHNSLAGAKYLKSQMNLQRQLLQPTNLGLGFVSQSHTGMIVIYQSRSTVCWSKSYKVPKVQLWYQFRSAVCWSKSHRYDYGTNLGLRFVGQSPTGTIVVPISVCGLLVKVPQVRLWYQSQSAVCWSKSYSYNCGTNLGLQFVGQSRSTATIVIPISACGLLVKVIQVSL